MPLPTVQKSAPAASNPIDSHIGQCIRQFRRLRGLTLQELSGILNISFQQLQKYEKGTNRVSASKLYAIALALKVHPHLFFHGMQKGNESSGQNFQRQSTDIAATIEGISDDDIRAKLEQLVDSIAAKDLLGSSLR
jgi:transcriptional regulator with XRE-family HTH domain